MEKKITSIRIGKRTEEGLSTLRQAWGMTLSETISVLVEKEIADMGAKTRWDIHDEYGSEVGRIAEIAGATGIEYLGDGGEGKMHCTFFALTGPGAKFPIRGATTNADPVWEDEDSQVFADLAEACGVTL